MNLSIENVKKGQVYELCSCRKEARNINPTKIIGVVVAGWSGQPLRACSCGKGVDAYDPLNLTRIFSKNKGDTAL